MDKFKIYLSGPISGSPIEEVQAAFNRGEEIAVKSVSQYGDGREVEVVNPLNNGLPYAASWNDHIVKDTELLLACEAVLMLDGWQFSIGARIEHYIAHETRKLVVYETKGK